MSYAQEFRATLTGIVTDPSGAAVPEAIVKAINTGTQTSKEVKPTSIGNYTTPFLDPGSTIPYTVEVDRIEVSASGFHTMVRENVVLQVADK